MPCVPTPSQSECVGVAPLIDWWYKYSWHIRNYNHILQITDESACHASGRKMAEGRQWMCMRETSVSGDDVRLVIKCRATFTPVQLRFHNINHMNSSKKRQTLSKNGWSTRFKLAMCYEGALVELSSIFGGKKGEKPSIEIARSCANKYTAQDGIGKTSGGKKPRITSLS